MVYLETRGTGRSEGPSKRTEYTWDHFRADLEALRMHLRQEQVWLAGHSQGGLLVMNYAISYPDRVKGLLIIDSAPGFDAEMLNDAVTRASQQGYGDIIVAPITQSERLHRGIRNSKLLVFEKAGHFPWIEAQEAFFEGVRAFLPEIG